MGRSGKKTWIGVALVIVLCASAHAQDGTITGKADIIDGDTINVGVVTVRLHGIDAPEAGQKCRLESGGTWACGEEAVDRLEQLIGEEAVECRALDRDQYGRIIATCDAGGIDLSGQLVREGLAWAFARYSTDYVADEKTARFSQLGIWRAETETPWDYRANRWTRAADASPRPGCPIKGNISRSGERIYHTPWSPWYGRTKITEANGEMWFCDEAEAVAAGWRPARAR